MPRYMHEMDEQELGALIEKLSESVERLRHERPGSGEYNHEAEVLKDARRLLAEKRKKKQGCFNSFAFLILKVVTPPGTRAIRTCPADTAPRQHSHGRRSLA